MSKIYSALKKKIDFKKAKKGLSWQPLASLDKDFSSTIEWFVS